MTDSLMAIFKLQLHKKLKQHIPQTCLFNAYFIVIIVKTRFSFRNRWKIRLLQFYQKSILGSMLFHMAKINLATANWNMMLYQKSLFELLGRKSQNAKEVKWVRVPSKKHCSSISRDSEVFTTLT